MEPRIVNPDPRYIANALMPVAIYTNLQHHTGGKGSGRTPADQFKSVQQGAATSVLLAVSPRLEGVGGRYFVDCNEAETVDRRTGNLGGVARYALDPDDAERQWTGARLRCAGEGTAPAAKVASASSKRASARRRRQV